MEAVYPVSGDNIRTKKYNSSKTVDENRLDVSFDYLYHGFHNGPVTGADICTQRPLIATFSKKDSTIRIWNYMSHRCEVARKFKVESQGDSTQYEPLLSIAFHPSGYYLAAGFIDKTRVFHIMHDELREFHKDILIKNCDCMKFSNGGHYLACVFQKHKSPQYLINIYVIDICKYSLHFKEN